MLSSTWACVTSTCHGARSACGGRSIRVKPSAGFVRFARVRALSPPLRADEGDEPHATETFLLVVVLAGSRHAHQLLLLWSEAHRDHEPPPDDELRPERLRYRGAARRDDDGVVGRMCRTPESSVSVQDVDVVIAQLPHSAACRLRERS